MFTKPQGAPPQSTQPLNQTASWMLAASIPSLQVYLIMGPYFYDHPMPAFLAMTRSKIYSPGITSTAISALSVARLRVGYDDYLTINYSSSYSSPRFHICSICR